ncbi:putative Ig domain-containing protein, partial [Poseidonibacter sp.]|uniref:putative Ig domain-containing protein n=1 Tax=Poseidonibacter sp. TaxID=2321188 RepID=UPI003C70F7B8
ISITLSLDDNAKGTLSTTTIASTTPSLAQTALRAITFTQTNNRVTPDTSETTTITITVNDGTSTDTDNTTTVISTSINDAPTITGTPNTTVNQGVAYSFTPTGNDVDSGQTLLYSISTKPSWASFSTTTGVLNGTPTNSDVGTTSNIVIGVNDGNVTTHLPSFNLEVLNVNDAPVINTIFNDLALLEDNGTTSYDLNITDIDGDDLNLTVSSSNSSIIMVTPNWTNILKQADYNSTLDFNLTTQANANGFVTITIKLVDENNVIVTDWFDVNVTAVNDTPTFNNISKIVVYKNSSDKNVTLGITDVDDTNLTYSANIINQALVNTPTFNGNIMTITPKSNISGNTDINITVSDGEYNVSKSFNYKILSIEDGELKNNDITVSEDVNGTTTTLNIDGNVTISTNENDNNGSVSSKISIDGGTPTKVNSDINGTVVQFTDTGSQTTYSEGNVSAEVNATMTGKAIHSLDVNGTKTQATSEIIGATTTLKKVNGAIQLQTSV